MERREENEGGKGSSVRAAVHKSQLPVPFIGESLLSI